jgi:hypothetical protein
MTRAILLLPLLLAGCDLCGTYTVASGYELDGEPLDGTYKEACGAVRGSWGSWNLFGDDRAILFLEFSDMNTALVEMEVSMPLERMVAGEVIGLPDLLGHAAINDMAGNVFAGAALEEGSTVEIVSDRSDGDDPCTMEGGDTWDGPTFVLRWDLSFHSDGGGGETYDYAAVGKDTVGFDTFLSESCGGW